MIRSLTISLEKWTEAKKVYKSVGALTLTLSEFYHIIKLSEAYNITEKLGENISITSVDDKKRGKQFKLNYISLGDEPLSGYTVDQQNIINGLLSDFEFESDQDDEKFLIKVK